ncbi:MAG TPA: DUF4198 domain-containing protein [Desulfobulbus sp.]|nr:DUF4198 domain-containing protein [Desulfobulbus sp.]
MKKLLTTLLLGLIPVMLAGTNALAHFGMLIPERNIVDQEQRTEKITLSFGHPFSDIGLNMEKPIRFFVDLDGKQIDLTGSLHPVQVMQHQGWHTKYRFRRPGVYIFAVEPKPYWEPAEDIYIKHYTKTIVSAFGADHGWSRPVGLKTEIVPLLRPFGNYSGNTMVGRVLLNGKAASHTEVEVELYNRGRFSAPTPAHETQVIRTDERGIFSFTCPKPGWWGFAALHDADFTIPGPDGTDKTVELGAVLWLYMDPWQTAP